MSTASFSRRRHVSAAPFSFSAFSIDHGVMMLSRGEAQNAADAGALAAALYPLAALVQPPSLESIQSVSRRLDRMPAKSTYFYPKLLSGLVFNPLQ